MNKAIVGLCFALLLGLSGCSRQQSDWEKARAANTTDSYEQFLKKYPNGEFTAQAQARVKELYEERDWQKARDADTQEAYQAFLKQYPEGKWTEEARIRVENFSLAQAPNPAPGAAEAPGTAGGNTSGNPPGGNATGTTAAGAPNTGAPAAGAPATGAAAPAKPSAAAEAPTPASAAEAAKPAKEKMPSTVKASSKAKPVVAKASSKAGSYGIQLGAFKSGADAANERWAHLDKKYPKLLAGLSPTVVPLTGSSGTLYRLRVAGLTQKRARAICKTLKAKSQACVIIPPAHHRHQARVRLHLH